MKTQDLMHSLKAQVLDIALRLDNNDSTDLDLSWDTGEAIVVRRTFSPIVVETGVPSQIRIAGNARLADVDEAAQRLAARHFPGTAQSGV